MCLLQLATDDHLKIDYACDLCYYNTWCTYESTSEHTTFFVLFAISFCAACLIAKQTFAGCPTREATTYSWPCVKLAHVTKAISNAHGCNIQLPYVSTCSSSIAALAVRLAMAFCLLVVESVSSDPYWLVFDAVSHLCQSFRSCALRRVLLICGMERNFCKTFRSIPHLKLASMDSTTT